MQDKDGKIVKRSICSKCYKKIRNNFWKGIKNDLTPISIINQAKYKKIEKPENKTLKLKVMPVLPSIHDKVGNKKDNG